MLTQPLKIFGGKHYLAPKIVELMPKHIHYVEPYFGGGSVLLCKSPDGVSEVVNDIDKHLTNFWKVLRDEKAFSSFSRIVECVPFSKVEWEEAGNFCSYDCSFLNVEAAVAFFVRCRQSRSGGFKSFAPLSKNRIRRGMNEQASAWWNCVDGLYEVHNRLKRVVILCEEAREVIKREDSPNTLFYLDPPYLHETRVCDDCYRFEMSNDDHLELLKVIKLCRGKVMLSGYNNRMYEVELKGWRRVDFEIDNKVAGGKCKRVMIESVWMNF